jgi:hypothetical protein
MNMKMESDTVFCVICIAAFIGYSLGFQHAMGVVGAGAGMSSAIKAQENENKKVHKFTQTNVSVSELGKILTANNLIHPDSPFFLQTERHPEVLIVNNDNHDVDGGGVLGDGACNNSSKNEQVYHDTSETTTSVERKDEKNKIMTNISEEEYEVILENIKKVDVKRPQYYFGWFDSLF